ncbi:MAG: helix-turn-helix transcriptional regulator [Lachnospiraceae bacterium]|nr:helix-turn-helix transcriptional regulator [Lachnospiraceae bacterium]
MREKIVKWLEENKVTPLELSRRSGVKKSTVYNIVNGDADPMELGTSKVLAIAEAMGMTVEELFDLPPVQPISEPTPERMPLTNVESELLMLWRNATKESRDSVLMVLRCNQIVKKDAEIS